MQRPTQVFGAGHHVGVVPVGAVDLGIPVRINKQEAAKSAQSDAV